MSEVVQFTPERVVLGEYRTRQIHVDKLIMFPQVRDDVNPELENIKDSIATIGLINPIDVVDMDYAQLEKYVDFLNRLWSKDINVDDYLHFEEDGLFHVVAAGFTRTGATSQLNAEDPYSEYYLTCKIHNASTPEEIIALQLGENLHSQPRQEQRAIAVVEAYFIGLEQGDWRTQKEFIEKSGRMFSRRILSEALGFARLPLEARDFVFARQLSYNAAVALGQATETVAAYTHFRLGDSSEVTDINFHHAYKDKIGLMIAHICNTRLNGTAAKKYIQGQVNEMKRQLVASQDSGTESALFDMKLTDPGIAYVKELKRQYRDEIRHMAQGPYTHASRLIQLHGRLHGNEVDTEAYEVLQRSLRDGQSQLGALGVSMVAAHEAAEIA